MRFQVAGIDYRTCEPGDERPLFRLRRGITGAPSYARVQRSLSTQMQADDHCDLRGNAVGRRWFLALDSDDVVVGAVRISIRTATRADIETWSSEGAPGDSAVAHAVAASAYLASCGIAEASVVAHCGAQPVPGEADREPRTEQWFGEIDPETASTVTWAD